MLRHITVVSFEQAVAAPLATRLLASDGARVIKLERAEGDFARYYDKFAGGSSSYFTWLNHGKESCVVDLKRERDFVQKLVNKADVVVQNLAPGSADRLGLGSAQLRELRPELITMDISGYGQSSSRKAYDLLVTAEAGLCSITGSEQGGPGRVGVSVADISTGRAAYAAILRALYHRERTGEGASLAVSLFDVVAEMMTVPLLQYRATGKPPARMGMKHPSIAPYGAFRTKDGVDIIVSCQNEREWKSFSDKVLGDSRIALDERFDSGVKRVQNRPVLDDICSKTFAELHSKEVVKRLEDADVAYGTLNSVEDLSRHTCLAEVEVTNEFGINVKLPRDPVRDLIREDNPKLGPVPKIGADTERIKAEFSSDTD